MSNPTIKRNTLFIQKKFQTRSILTVVGIIALAGFVSGVILYFILSSEFSSETQLAHSQIQNAWDLLGPAILFGNIFTVIAAAVVAAIAVLYQSHKIAGPMYRLQKICEEVAQGNFNPVTKLRKEDQLTSLAMAFENMVASLKLREDRKNQAMDDVNELFSQIEQNADQSLKNTVEELRKKLDRL